MTTPPGWYPDPEQPGLLRRWDGERWRDERVAPAGSPFVAVPPAPPITSLPFVVAVGALVSMALPLLFSRVLLHPLSDHGWPVAVSVAIAAVVSYGPPLLFWRYASRRWGATRQAIGLTVRRSDAGWGPLTWLATFGAQLVAVVIIRLGHIPTQSNTDSIRALRDDRGFVVAMLVLAIVAAPIVEEIVFRGLMLRGLLSRWPVWAAVLVQGVLFGAAHIAPERGVRNIGLVLVLSAVGCVFGAFAVGTRRLAPSMIAHAIVNTIAMVVVLSGWTPTSEAVGPVRHRDVVDQAHVAEPHRGDGHRVLVGRLDGLEREPVDQFEMLEAR